MNRYRVKPDSRVRLKDYDPDDTDDYKKNDGAKAAAKKEVERLVARLGQLQERLYANGSSALLIVLQGMDTSGKDGTIKHVMSAVNPQGCKVVAFKTPSHEELAHDFLWRVHHEVPSKGFIGIFNRSHYEDVLITRVHHWIDDETAHRRMQAINHFENLLQQSSNTVIVKFYLHISREEQQERFDERLTNDKKHWKFNPDDAKEAALWDDYRKAYEECFEYCNNPPWIIVPADQNWYKEYIIAKTLVKGLKELNMKYPQLNK